MRHIESALAIIRNSGRILLTWGDGWNMWLLPNATIHGPRTVHDALRSFARHDRMKTSALTGMKTENRHTIGSPLVVMSAKTRPERTDVDCVTISLPN